MSASLARGVMEESSWDGIAVQAFSSRMCTTCAGY